MPAATSTVRHITITLALIALLAIMIQIVVVVFHYGNDQGYLDRAKTDQEVETIAAALSIDASGKLQLALPAPAAHRYQRYPDSYAFMVIDAEGDILAEANRAVFRDDMSLRGLGTDYSMACVERGTDRLCAASRRLELGGRSVWVQVAVSGDPADIVLGVFMREIIEDAGIPFLPVLVAMLVVNLVVVRRALRPLGRAAAEARRLVPGSDTKRLTEAGLPSEVLALVHSVNDMLVRTERVLDAQRQFSANAAHELRTPIAVLMLRLAEVEGDVADRMRNDLKSMSRQVDQLLELAKVDAIVVAPDSRVDLRAAARDAVETLAILAVDRGCELAFEDENGAVVRGNADAIQLALRNLIDNATRHSPPGGIVRVVAGPGPQLQIIDAGKGIPLQHRERIFHRFWRGSHNEGAAGLGLAIVKHVAESHGARIVIDDDAGIGTHIRLIFQLPNAAEFAPFQSSAGTI